MWGFMSGVEIRQRAASEGQRAAGEGKRGGPLLYIGLVGALIDIVEIWFGIANGQINQISINFHGVICLRHDNGGVL